MSFKVTGFDELQKQLKKMEDGAKELGKTKSVPFGTLFSQTFMRKYTNFSTFDELLENGGFIVETEKDFEAIPDDVFDVHIVNSTKFKSWEEMLSKATEIYVSKKLGLK